VLFGGIEKARELKKIVQGIDGKRPKDKCFFPIKYTLPLGGSSSIKSTSFIEMVC
jgi:hypothetical protein